MMKVRHKNISQVRKKIRVGLDWAEYIMVHVLCTHVIPTHTLPQHRQALTASPKPEGRNRTLWPLPTGSHLPRRHSGARAADSSRSP